MLVRVYVVGSVGMYFRGTVSEIKHMFRNSHIVWSNERHTNRIKLDFSFVIYKQIQMLFFTIPFWHYNNGTERKEDHVIYITSTPSNLRYTFVTWTVFTKLIKDSELLESSTHKFRNVSIMQSWYRDFLEKLLQWQMCKFHPICMYVPFARSFHTGSYLRYLNKKQFILKSKYWCKNGRFRLI